MSNAEIVTQPHLGSVVVNEKPHLKMGGLFQLAKVIKVHYKYYTADVQVIKTKDLIAGDDHLTEGKYSAKILTSHASAFSSGPAIVSSGVIEPIKVGSLVIIGFLEGNKSNPFILGCVHDTDALENNIMVDTYPLKEKGYTDSLKEAEKYLRVFPSQLYTRVDGVGGVEISHPSTTFLKISSDLDEEVSDAHSGYDHKDLREKDPYTGVTRSGKREETINPVKLLLAHRSSILDSDNTWLKLFIDKTGMFRLTRDNNDGKLSYFEVSEDGSLHLRRQNDTSHGFGRGSTISIEEDRTVRLLVDTSETSRSYLEILDSGDISIKRQGSTSTSEVYLSSDGTLKINNKDIEAEHSISLGNGEMVLKGSNSGSITLRNGGKIIISANSDLQLKDATDQVSLSILFGVRTEAIKLRKEVDALTERLDTAEQTIQTLLASITSLTQRVTSLENQI